VTNVPQKNSLRRFSERIWHAAVCLILSWSHTYLDASCGGTLKRRFRRQNGAYRGFSFVKIGYSAAAGADHILDQVSLLSSLNQFEDRWRLAMAVISDSDFSLLWSSDLAGG
jgi:hypothetical protein